MKDKFYIEFYFRWINCGEKWEQIVESIHLVDYLSDFTFLNYSHIADEITIGISDSIDLDINYILRNAYLIEDDLKKIFSSFIRDRNILADAEMELSKIQEYSKYFNKRLIRKIKFLKILKNDN